MAKERLIYLPLGGAGEIGMNAYVYGYGPKDKERLILVDAGVTFPSMDGTPGVDLIIADIAWLKERADRLEAIFITHAHEDHVGALGLMMPDLNAPVYTRAFTGLHAVRKLEDRGLDGEVVNIVAPYPETVSVGPFEVAFLPISHSIPESSGLLISTPGGRVVHTGDFKLDQSPIVGEAWDPDLWGKACAGGIRALVCDSTNIFSPNPGRSEATLSDNITALIADAPRMVVATTFASNVARVKTLAMAGKRAGRSVVLLGRAMRRMIEASVEAGVLSDFPAVISPEDAAEVPRENLLLLVTGSQGERRAASAQLSNGKYMGIELAEGDLFLFSSKTIPGNEVPVGRIMNRFSEMGVRIVDDDGGNYHVSGHANRPDLSAMHKVVAPDMVVPMHGEHMHLRAHHDLARENGLEAIIAPNGTMVELSAKGPRVVDQIEAGRTYLDGGMLIGAFDGVIRERMKMAINGQVTVGVIIDEDDEPIADAWVEINGLSPETRSGDDLGLAIEQDIADQLGRIKPRVLMDDDDLTREIRRMARRACETAIGKRPEVTVLISRLTAI